MPLPDPKTKAEAIVRIIILILLLIPMTAFIAEMIGPFLNFLGRM